MTFQKTYNINRLRSIAAFASVIAVNSIPGFAHANPAPTAQSNTVRVHAVRPDFHKPAGTPAAFSEPAEIPVTTIQVGQHPIQASVALAEPLDLSGPGITLTNHTPKLLATSKLAGRMSPDQQLTITFALKPRNKSALDTLAKRLYDTTDSLYRKFIKPSERMAQFSPTQEDFNKVAYYAQQMGLKVTDSSTDRMLIHATGSVATIESGLAVHLNNYTSPNGKTFFSNDTDPTVPAAIAPLLTGILRLTNADTPQSNAVEAPPAPSGGSAQPDSLGVYTYQGIPAGEVRNVYDIGIQQGSTHLTGNGQHVALLELGGFDYSDISYYIYYNSTWASPLENLSYTPINTFLMNGYNGADDADTKEVELDIELLEAITDGLSAIDLYEDSGNGDIIGEMDQALADDTANQVSVSYGFDEDSSTAGTESEVDLIAEEMALQGQAMFVASGDEGAYGEGQTNLTVNGLGASPWVTCVGGTSLSIDINPFDPNFLGFSGESAWDGSSTSATGGGVSYDFACPSYQQGYFNLLPNSLNSPASYYNRNVPDVALDADPYSGYYTHLLGSDKKEAGTSAAAPIWAAFWAQLNQARAIAGAGPAGFANNVLYALAQTGNYNSDFNDVTSGNNNYYNTETGYDCATGLGSLQGVNLMNDLLDQPAFSAISSFQGPTDRVSGGTVPLTLALNSPVPTGLSGEMFVYQQAPGGSWTYIAQGTIPAGQSTGTIDVKAPVVTTITPYSYIAIVEFANASTGTVLNNSVYQSQTISVNIHPNALSTFTVSPYDAFGGSTIIGTVTLIEPATSNLQIDLDSYPAGLTMPTAVFIPQGQTSVSFHIPTAVESTYFDITLYAVADYTSTVQQNVVTTLVALGPLLNSVSVDPYEFYGGNSGVGTVQLNATATKRTIVTLKSNSGLIKVPAQVAVLAGNSSATFNVTTLGTKTAEAGNITATLQGASQFYTVVVTPAVSSGLSFSSNPATGPTTVIATLSLNGVAPSGGLRYKLTSSNSSAVKVQGSVMIPAGASSVTFNLTLNKVSKSKTVTITATGTSPADTANGQITDL